MRCLWTNDRTCDLASNIIGSVPTQNPLFPPSKHHIRSHSTSKPRGLESVIHALTYDSHATFFMPEGDLHPCTGKHQLAGHHPADCYHPAHLRGTLARGRPQNGADLAALSYTCEFQEGRPVDDRFRWLEHLVMPDSQNVTALGGSKCPDRVGAGEFILGRLSAFYLGGRVNLVDD